jgi:hypothetical protein
MKGLGIFIFVNILLPELLGADVFPIPLEAYATPSAADGLGQILLSRIKIAPFNFFATLIFLLAIIHTFFAPYFSHLAHRFHRDTPRDKMLATLFHFLGEVEVIFGLWIIPLIFTILRLARRHRLFSLGQLRRAPDHRRHYGHRFE